MTNQSTFDYDVFLSYCWADKPAVLKIRDALKSRKLNIWFDEVNMRDKLNAAMAKGIGSSTIFVCCLSKNYEKSDNAMAEFRYASYIKKKFIAIRLEDEKRHEEIEFVVGPTLWFLFVNGNSRQLSQAAYYIEKEVDILSPRLHTGTLRVITLIDIDFTRNTQLECIGSGGFGAIYKIKLDNTEDVVLKKLHDLNPSLKAKREFLNEAQIMARLTHPRLVRFYGIVDDPETKIMGIVMEYVSRGSLFDLIERIERPISLSKRIYILLDIATGIKVLHDQNILHKDIKSKNILIDEQWRAKICDFGLAKIKQEVSTLNPEKNQFAGTTLYMAPELFDYDSASELTDVYAFAIVVTEVITWSGPYGLNLEEVDPRAVVQNILMSKIPRINLPLGTPDGFEEFLADCPNRDPQKRPLFGKIREVLFGFLQSTCTAEQVEDTIEEDLSQKFNSILNSEINLHHSKLTLTTTVTDLKNGIIVGENTECVEDSADELDPIPFELIIAIHDFTARSEKELGFVKGDVMIVKKRERTWIFGGKMNFGDGQHTPQESTRFGWIPDAFVSKLTTDDKDGQFTIGVSYEHGFRVLKNYSKAANWYTKAADQGHSGAQFRLGVCYENGNGVTEDYIEAVKWYTRSAEQGCASAQFCLGACYEHGVGVMKSYTAAAKWYTTAAENGYASAQCRLGICYENGIRIVKDNAEAVKWYTKAADQGYASAQFRLGVCYENGNGVIQDNAEAVKWYEKAADQGFSAAKHNLVICLNKIEATHLDIDEKASSIITLKTFYTADEYIGIGDGSDTPPFEMIVAIHDFTARSEKELGFVKGDVMIVKERKRTWIFGGKINIGDGQNTPQESTRRGWIPDAYVSKLTTDDKDGQFTIGVSYEHGFRVLKNYSKAANWYTKAADQGHSGAQFRLGVCYENGNGVTEDYIEAVKWYTRSAEQGCASAQFRLAVCYEKGYGVARDYAEAIKWYGKAADQGFPTAQENLDACRNNLDSSSCVPEQQAELDNNKPKSPTDTKQIAELPLLSTYFGLDFKDMLRIFDP